MPDRLYSAFKTMWDDANLVATFTGGIWFRQAPDGTSFPYVTIVDTGDAEQYMTTGDDSNEARFSQQTFQVNIFTKEDNVTDPIVLLGALARTLDDAVQASNREFSVPTSEGKIIDVRKLSSVFQEADDVIDRVWNIRLEYSARRLWNITA